MPRGLIYLKTCVLDPTFRVTIKAGYFQFHQDQPLDFLSFFLQFMDGDYSFSKETFWTKFGGRLWMEADTTPILPFHHH